MTASSELFITESIEPMVQAILNQRLPKKYPEIHLEIPMNWMDICDPADYPSEGTANMLNLLNEQVIGTVYFPVHFEIVNVDDHRYVDSVVPEEWELEIKLTGEALPAPELKQFTVDLCSEIVMASDEEEAKARVHLKVKEEGADVDGVFAEGE